jgi:hypothetical protein
LSLEEALVRVVGSIKGASAHPSQFAPVPAFWIDGREFVHLHSESVLDIRLTKRLISAKRKRLKTDQRVTLRNSDWLTVEIEKEDDIPFVLRMVKEAANANRRKRGEKLRAMPDDKHSRVGAHGTGPTAVICDLDFRAHLRFL